MNLNSAISAVNKNGALLVFSIKNRKEPLSLWSHFFPKSQMKWEWDEDGDHRVADLWHLREKISSSEKVIYCKWFQNRATLISKDLYPAFLRLLNDSAENSTQAANNLSDGAQKILSILKDNSPLSTKQLKEESGLSGKFFESDYNKRMNELWRKLLIVGVGEIDDGAFPSLAIASAENYFEDECRKAFKLTREEAIQKAAHILGSQNVFFKYLIKYSSKNY
ncbi:MAG: hypothetical protein J0L93_04410 [Deltaproteobacteria bacterium]|nr:hypothetical protein [Deltaproteobacteria bacterium]